MCLLWSVKDRISHEGDLLWLAWARKGGSLRSRSNMWGVGCSQMLDIQCRQEFLEKNIKKISFMWSQGCHLAFSYIKMHMFKGSVWFYWLVSNTWFKFIFLWLIRINHGPVHLTHVAYRYWVSSTIMLVLIRKLCQTVTFIFRYKWSKENSPRDISDL